MIDVDARLIKQLELFAADTNADLRLQLLLPEILAVTQPGQRVGSRGLHVQYFQAPARETTNGAMQDFRIKAGA